jgi:hypothetical protein
MGAKWLEVLKELTPSVRKIGFLFNLPIATCCTSLIAVWMCSTFSSGFVEASHA